jgi:hypothetical protein
MARRKVLLVPFSAVAFVLIATSLAWACITVKGEATIAKVVHKSDAAADCGDEEKCAAPGDVIKAKATGSVPLTEYFLHFRNYNATNRNKTNCYGNAVEPDEKISTKSVVSDETGKIRALKGTIPASAESTTGTPNSLFGPSLVCFIDTSRNILTEADTLTII